MASSAGERAHLEARAQGALVVHLSAMVNALTADARRYAPGPMERRVLMRQVRVLRSPDASLQATLADMMLAADVVGGYHAIVDALPRTFATLDPSNLSTWPNSRVVDRALTFLQAKEVLTPTEFRALRDLYRSAGFSIAGVTEYDMLEVARRSLKLSARRGYDNARATDSLQRALVRAGYDRLRPWHARLVAQMNFASAYGAGSWETLHNPRIAGIIPAYEYVTQNDEKVRLEHDVMHGYKAVRTAAIWNEWWPPCGYNCRCYIKGISVTRWRALSQYARTRPWPTLDGNRVHPDRGPGYSFRGSPRRYVEAKARAAREGRAA